MNIHPSIFDFLKALKDNNNREWFQANKNRYERAKKEFETFVDLMIPKIATFEKEIGYLKAKDCTYRIYRDIRFSADKSPYKTNFGSFWVPGGKKSNLGGYYLHIEPGGHFIGGGIHMPQNDVLKIIRKEIYDNIDEFKEILENREFKKFYKEIDAAKLKNPPRDFPKNWPDIDLLKFTSYTVGFEITENEMLKDDFSDYLFESFRVLSPFVIFFNKALSLQ